MNNITLNEIQWERGVMDQKIKNAIKDFISNTGIIPESILVKKEEIGTDDKGVLYIPVISVIIL